MSLARRGKSNHLELFEIMVIVPAIHRRVGLSQLGARLVFVSLQDLKVISMNGIHMLNNLNIVLFRFIGNFAMFLLKVGQLKTSLILPEIPLTSHSSCEKKVLLPMSNFLVFGTCFRRFAGQVSHPVKTELQTLPSPNT